MQTMLALRSFFGYRKIRCLFGIEGTPERKLSSAT
jgi:hypothetical protein